VKDPTLSTLIEVVKSKPRLKFLVCPVDDCRRAVELQGGIYRCAVGHETETLRELAVKEP
jgi:hypothetical protein